MLRLRRVLPLLACGSLGLACGDDGVTATSDSRGTSSTGDSTGSTSSSGSGAGDVTGSGSQGGDHATGIDDTADATTTTTGDPPPECGNGVVEGDEECDDAGESSACNADCTFVFCGDGTVNTTAEEQCDDMGESPTCNLDCTMSVCGDKVLNETAGEQCDAGMEAVDCDDDCTPVECGDGNVNETVGEQCDDMGESETCNADCTFIGCGDGIINVAAGEECDDMGESETCNVDCTSSMCGDAVINMTAGEACDDGGDSIFCDADCTPVECGDGYVNMATEACDAGMQTASCDSDCTPVACGDGVVNVAAGEQCDAGGASAACDVDCTPAVCGDAVSNPVAGEGCDDGNLASNDGCSSTCQPDCDDLPGNNDCASALRMPAAGEIDQGEIVFVNGIVGYAGARDYIEVVFAANDATHRNGSKLPGMLRIYIDDPLFSGSPADIANTNVRFRVFEDIIPSGCESPLNYTVPFTGGTSGPLQNNATNDTILPGPGYATEWEWSDTCDPLGLAGGANNCAPGAYTAPHPLPTSFWVEVLPAPDMPDACMPYTLVATWQ
jgi:cysteine-rich repeat protein